MRRLFLFAALIFWLPAQAHAQNVDHAPFPQEWMTLDSFGAALGLTAEQRTAAAPPLQAINDLLRAATGRRNEHKGEFQNSRKVAAMDSTERAALRARLAAIRTDFDERQAALDREMAALRLVLTTAQAPAFDALPKPRLAALPKPGK